MARARGGFLVKDSDLGWKKLKRALAMLSHGDSYAKAGIIGEKAQADHGGLTNEEVALIQEFGTADGHIPSRSFLREPYDANRERYMAALTKLIQAVYDGKIEVEHALALVGKMMESDMREAIRRGIPPPNAAATIAKKGSSKPLIDKGQLIGAISSAVVLHGEDGGIVNAAEKKAS
jgi:hypothetical protein